MSFPTHFASRYAYRPVEQRLHTPETGSYVAYGIRALDGAREAAFIPDVSCSRDFVCALAARCARLQLHPMQLLDVVLDALA